MGQVGGKRTARLLSTRILLGSEHTMTNIDNPLELLQAGLAHLVRHPEPITYSDFNSVPGSPFDLSSDEGRYTIGQVLGLITDRLREDNPYTRHFMISALVHTKGGDPGAEFYKLATELDLLKPNASDFDKMEFWVNQVKAIQTYYGDS
jgi:hypothetical protein